MNSRQLFKSPANTRTLFVPRSFKVRVTVVFSELDRSLQFGRETLCTELYGNSPFLVIDKMIVIKTCSVLSRQRSHFEIFRGNFPGKGLHWRYTKKFITRSYLEFLVLVVVLTVFSIGGFPCLQVTRQVANGRTARSCQRTERHQLVDFVGTVSRKARNTPDKALQAGVVGLFKLTFLDKVNDGRVIEGQTVRKR